MSSEDHNAWLSVSLYDYESHMASPAVGQLPLLSALFAEALAWCSPQSVAILGVAGGNGLERIDSFRTKRICGIDINQSYLDATARRFAALPGLELYQADLGSPCKVPGRFDLVHAALIFEHAGTGCCLDNAVELTRPGGVLSVVLQLPSTVPGPAIAPQCASIERLKPGFRLIEAHELRGQLDRRRFHLERQLRRPVPAGKALWLGLFRRDG